MQSVSRFSMSFVLSLILASACSPADANPARERPRDFTLRDLEVTAFDFAFQAPDTVPAGLTRVRMKSTGPSIHHVQIARLEGGHTVRQLVERIEAGEFAPSWVTYVGGPEPVPFSEEGNATVDLAPGNYALICLISSEDHIRHLAKGMVRALTVLPASTQPVPSVAEPQADARMVLRDYDFDITPTLKSGRRTIRVENHAQQPHHAELVRMVDGKTLADLEAWQKSRQGPQPFDFAGGVTVLTPGQVNFFTVDLVPGNYLLFCFVPDVKDGKSHVRHGMVRQITID